MNNAWIQRKTSRNMELEETKPIKSNIPQPINFQQQSKHKETGKLHDRTSTGSCPSSREDTLNRIIDKLISKGGQHHSSGVKHNTNRQNYFQKSISNEHVKQSTEHLNTVEIVGKLDTNCLQKNKRLIVNRSYEHKQTHLTKFFSVVKSLNNNEPNIAGEFNKRPLPNYTANNEFKNSNRESGNTESLTSKRTCHEICDDILIKLAKKSKLTEIKHNYDNKTQMLLKSFSTGDLIEKEKDKNVNSVPITECETKNAIKQLETKKIEFDKFLDRIITKMKLNENIQKSTELDAHKTDIEKDGSKSLKEMKYNNCNQNIGKCFTEPTQKYEYSSKSTLNYYPQNMQIHQDHCIHKDICHDKEKMCNINPECLEKAQDSNFNLGMANMQNSVEMRVKPRNMNKNDVSIVSAFNSKQVLPNYTAINIFRNSNQERENTELLPSSRTNFINNELENYDFVVPKTSGDKRECKKTCEQVFDDKQMNLAKKRKSSEITPESKYKTNIFSKFFSTGDVIEMGNHENVNTVPISERGKTEFDNLLEKILSKTKRENPFEPNKYKTDNNEKYDEKPSQKYEDSQFTENCNSEYMTQDECINGDDICENNEEIKFNYIQWLEKEAESSQDLSVKNFEHSVEKRIDSLENGLEKSILKETLKKHNTNIEQNKRELEPDKSVKLNNFIQDIVLKFENKDSSNCQRQKNKCLIKRYKKGKTRIYRLKKLRKKPLQTEEIDDYDILEKVTTDNCESQCQLLSQTSGSSISTPSSFVSDDTKSENLSRGSEELTSPQRRLRNGFNELSKDKSLYYTGKEWEDVTEHDKECIKMKLQDIFFQVLQDFKDKKPSYFKHRRQCFDNCIFKDGRLQLKPASEASVTIISSRVQNSKPKFQLMLYIMKKIQTLLENNTKLTKREVYYQLKEFISDQRASDRAINAISCLLEVGMWAFNIIAQKGLVFGDLKLLLSSGEILNCNIPGVLIPQDISAIVEIHSSAYFILVVEKESIFHKLIQDDLPNKLTRPFILITGKGFPDLNTQLFLKKLWMVMSIPVFILVDADPHGINIMLNYRFGSVSNAHVSQHLAVPNAKWLGVYPSEVINFNIARQPLSERDIKLIKSTLATPYMEFSTKLSEELNVLLTNNYKASIEGLLKTDSYLSGTYLPNKFFSHKFI